MSDFTEQEFNEAMADLMDVHVSWGISKGRTINMVIAGHWAYASFMPYNDLNQLMPIAWKYGVHLVGYHDNSVFAQAKGWSIKSGIYQGEDKETKATRQCLWQIAKEQK